MRKASAGTPESLSSYARQFLGMMHKPDVDSIEGLSRAIFRKISKITKIPMQEMDQSLEYFSTSSSIFSNDSSKSGTPLTW